MDPALLIGMGIVGGGTDLLVVRVSRWRVFYFVDWGFDGYISGTLYFVSSRDFRPCRSGLTSLRNHILEESGKDVWSVGDKAYKGLCMEHSNIRTK